MHGLKGNVPSPCGIEGDAGGWGGGQEGHGLQAELVNTASQVFLWHQEGAKTSVIRLLRKGKLPTAPGWR